MNDIFDPENVQRVKDLTNLEKAIKLFNERKKIGYKFIKIDGKTFIHTNKTKEELIQERNAKNT